MANEARVDPRQIAIEKFVEASDLQDKAMKSLLEICKQDPQAILIAWEVDGVLRATTVPPSAALARGMADLLFDMLVAPQGDDDDD